MILMASQDLLLCFILYKYDVLQYMLGLTKISRDTGTDTGTVNFGTKGTELCPERLYMS